MKIGCGDRDGQTDGRTVNGEDARTGERAPGDGVRAGAEIEDRAACGIERSLMGDGPGAAEAEDAG